MVAPTVENSKTVQRGPVSCSTLLPVFGRERIIA